MSVEATVNFSNFKILKKFWLDHVPWRWSKKYHTIDFISYAIIFFIDQGIQLFLQTITWELDKLHEIHISLWITIHQASSNNSIAECQNYMSDILQRARRSGQWWSKCMRLDRKGVAVDHMKYVYITYFIEIKLTHVFLWLKLRVTTTRCCSLLPSIAVFYAVLCFPFLLLALFSRDSSFNFCCPSCLLD